MNSFTKCLVVFVLSLVSVASLKAEDFVIDGIYYSTESLPQGQVEIRGSRPPYVHDLVIPSTITSSSGSPYGDAHRRFCFDEFGGFGFCGNPFYGDEYW